MYINGNNYIDYIITWVVEKVKGTKHPKLFNILFSLEVNKKYYKLLNTYVCLTIGFREMCWDLCMHLNPCSCSHATDLLFFVWSGFDHRNFVRHCTIIKWFPPPQNHPTLECQISVHIGPSKLKFLAVYGNFFGPVQYVLHGEIKYTSPIKPHLGCFAQVKLGTKISQKNRTKKNVKLSGCANLPYAEKNAFLNSRNHFLQISGLKNSNF